MDLTVANFRSYCSECGDCLVWKLACNRQGYPSARVNGKVVNVRRYLWEAKAGRKLGANQIVGSSCGNTRCLAHIVAQTRGDVTAKSYEQGKRSHFSEYRARHAALVARGLSKLDWEKARQIRARRGECTKALAEEFGVCKSTVVKVLAGICWVEHAKGATVFGWRP